MSKRISMSLSHESIQNAVKEIRQYKSDLNKKCEELCRRLAVEGIQIAQAHIGDSGFGKYIRLASEITPEHAGCRAVLYMEDTAKITSEWQTKEGTRSATISPILMIEFGSGLKAQNPAGISGVGTGTFPGHTHAEDPGGWYYMDLDGVWHHSTGVEAKMPIYFAGKEMREKIVAVAKEVFGA